MIKKLLFVFFFFFGLNAYAQTFKKHYIAPAPWQYFNDANEVVITTNTPGTTVTIRKSDGALIETITVDPATPATYRFTTPLGATSGSNYNALNTVLTDRGMIVEGDNPITVNVRNLYTASDFSRMVGVASLFSFGDAAIGTSFRVGYYRDGNLNAQSFSRRPVYSVMAIENNTTVRVNGTTLVTLKAGESYLFNANMGSLVETSASAVVNTGTLMDTPNICGDAAYNSVPPIASLGSEYLTLRSAGNNTAEQTTIIATEPNTSVVVTNYNTDGTVFSSNTYTLVSAGSFVTVNTGIPGSCSNFSLPCGVQYSATKISATKNVLAFSGVAYGCEADVLTLVPLASCGGSLVAKTFKYRDLNNTTGILEDIDYFGYITIKSPTEKVYLTTTGPTPYTNVDIETIPGVGVRRQIGSTGIYLIDFTRANIGTPDAITLTSGIGINAAMIAPSPGVAMANYFTPLPEQAKRPILVPETDCTKAELKADPLSEGPFQWYKDSYPIAGATSDTYKPTVSGAYSITTMLGCGVSTQSVPVSVYLCNIDRGITKTVDNPNPPIDGTVRFTITASNSGSGDALGVYATDILESGFSFISYTSTAGTSYNNATGVWSIGTLPAGSTATLVITAKVLALGNHNNTASISGTQTDPNPANDTANQSVTPVSAITLTSAAGTDAQTICYNSPGTPITYKAPLGSVTVTGLPSTFGFTIAADASDPLAQIIRINRTSIFNTVAGLYTYTVKIVTAAGDVITTGTIKVDGANAAPVFDLGPTSTRCQGFGTQIYKATSANTRGITYSIVTTPASSGNTIYAVIDPNTGEVTWSPNFVGTARITAVSAGCFGNRSATHDVTVTTSGTVTGTSPVCSGDNGQLTRTGAATFKRWEYSIDGGTNWNVFAGTFTSTTLDYTNIQATTDFRAIVDVGSCVDIPTRPFTVVVTQRPVIANQTFNFCGGTGSFTFQPVDVPAGTTYTWSAPIVTGTVTGATAGTAQSSVTQNLTNNGSTMATVTYNVTPTNGICPGTAFTITVTIPPASITASAANPAIICSGKAFSVTPTSSLTNLKYTWTASVLSGTNISGFSDQTTPQDAPISQTLVNNGTTTGVVRYTVTPVLNNCNGTPFTFDVTIEEPPVTSDVTHPGAISNQSNGTTISTLAGTDEGSVDSYIINTLPDSGTGILTLADGTPVTVGQVVTAAQASTLQFKPLLGYVGQANFTFSATDNDGCSDLTPATYTINVVRPETDLAISKTANPKPAVAGQPLTYTITLTNNGPGALLSSETVTVTDNLPAGFTATTYTASSGTYNQSTGDWTGLSLATGQSASITIQGDVAPNASGTLNNTANLTLPATITDPTPANNTATDATPISEKPVLVVVKTGLSGVTAGTQVQYSIKVSNTGPSNAVGAIIEDVVDASMTNVSWTATPSGAASVTSGATGTGNNVSLEGNIPTGAANFITLTVTGMLNSSATGSLSNTATAKPSVSQPDGTSGSSTFVSSINSSTGITLTKTAPATAISGSVISYQLEVGNNGPSDAPVVNVADVISAELTNVSWTATTGGSASINSGATGNNNNNLALVGSIPAGAANKIIITITGTISSAFSGNLTNTASATPQGGTAVNASASTAVTAFPTFSFSKSGPATANAGQTIQYILTAKNTGTSNSTASVISDVVPNTLTNVSWTASVSSGTATITGGASGTGNNVSVTANTQPNAIIEVLVTGTLPSGFSGTLNNSANITPSEAGTTPVSSAVTTTVNRVPTLSIQKLGPATLAAGQPITYTIRVTNTGKADAIASVITDAIPSAILNPSWTAAVEGSAVVTAGAGGSGAALNVTGNIPAGSGNAIVVTVLGTVDPAQSTNIENKAIVTPAESGGSSVESAVTTTVTKQPNIVINKTGPASVYAGETVTYQIDVTNNGPSNATALPITDVVPAILTNVSWTATASGSSAVNVGSGNGDVLVSADVKVGAANKISILVTGTVPSNQTATTINNQASATPAETGVTVNSNQVATTIGIKNGLKLTKTGPASISAGQQITYTILAENNGPSDATDAEITDAIPSGISNITWTTAVNGATASAGTLTGNDLSIMASIPSGVGNSVLITITGTVDAAFSGTNLSNMATARPSELGNPSVNSNTVITTVGKSADLRIVKTGPQAVVAGQTINYNLVVTNAGPSIANNVSIEDVIPTGLNNVTWSATAEGNPATTAVLGATSGSGTPTLLANIGTATADKINVVVTGTLAPDYALTEIENTATARPESGVADPTPATASVTSTVSRFADIRITKSAPANAGPGETITYTLDVTNIGLSDAIGTHIVDDLPAQITLSSWTVTTSNGATTNVQNGTGNVDLMADIPKGENVQVVIVAKIDPNAVVGTIVTNTAMATEGPSITDSDPTNNEASADTELVANGSYRISKTGPNTASVGETIRYEVLVQNTGISPLTGVQIDDVVPSGLTDVTWTATVVNGAITSPSGGSGNSVSITGDLGPESVLGANDGGKINVVILATVSPAALSTIVNTATVSVDPSQVPLEVSSRSSDKTTSVIHSADISVVKTGPATAIAGDVLKYTIVAENFGPADANNIKITDIIPAELGSVSWTATDEGGTVLGTGTGDIDLPVNLLARTGKVTINVTSVVPSDTSPQTISNTATYDLNGATFRDYNPNNDVSTVMTDIVNDAQLVVQKSGPATASSGGVISYVVRVSNTGLSDATGVSIEDFVPSMITNVSWTSTSGGGAMLNSGDTGIDNNILTATGDMPGGSYIEFYITGRIDPNYTGFITNKAEAYIDVASKVQSTVVTSVSKEAALSIVKNAPSTLNSGETLTYTIQVNNAGPSNLVNTEISDNVSNSLSNVTWSAVASGGATINTGATGTGNIVGLTADMPVGTQILITVSGKTASDFDGTIKNTATVRPSEPGLAAVQSNETTTTVSRKPSLTFQKSAPSNVNAGERLAYTLVLENNGLSDAIGTQITDNIPSALTGVQWTSVSTGSAFVTVNASGTGNTLAATADVPVGGKVVFNISGLVAPTATGSIINSATASPIEPGTTQIVASTSTAVRQKVDIVVAKSGPANAKAGESITYVVTVKNNGPSMATGLSITDMMPTALQSWTWTATANGNANITNGGNTGTGNINLTADLGAANSDEIRITVNGVISPSYSGAFSNTATATPTSGTGAAASSVVNTTVTRSPNLVITKTGPVSAINGGAVNYQIVVSNNGPSDALNAAITDVVNSNLTGVSWTATKQGAATILTGGVGNSNNVAVTANIPGGTGNTVTINITGTLNNSATGHITNTATATPSEPGISPVISQEVKTAVKPSGSPDNGRVLIGTSGTITVKNNDTNPTGLTVYKNADPANGTAVVNPDGTITYTPNPGFTGTDTFTYRLQSPEGVLSDPITVTMTVYVASLDLKKQAAVTPVSKAGDVINYTFTVTNTGQAVLNNIVVSDAKADAGSITPANIATLAIGASATATAKHTLTQAEVDAGSFSNQASASGKDENNNTISDMLSDNPLTPPANDPTVVTIAAMPSIALVKSGVLSADGKTVNYTFTIKNTGNVTLNTFTLTDTKLGMSNQAIVVTGGLAPNATTTYSASYTVNQQDLDAGSVTNTATINAKSPAGTDVSDVSGTAENNATPTITALSVAPGIRLVKAGVLSTDGKTINYIFTIKNTGNVTLNTITLTDSKLGMNNQVVNVTGGLAPNATTTYSATYTLTQADDAIGKVTNSATVNAKTPTGANVSDVSGTDESNNTPTVTVTDRPTVGLAKAMVSAVKIVNGSYDVTYMFTVANMGVAALSNLSIKDDLRQAFAGTDFKVKSLTSSGGLSINPSYNGSADTELLQAGNSLAAGKTEVFNLTVTVAVKGSNTYLNSAVVNAVSVTGLNVTDQSTDGLKPDPLAAGDVTPSVPTPVSLTAPVEFIPGGFSPNGDGVNDKFVVENTGAKHIAIEIFNRWGNRVYRSADYKNDWDGRCNEGIRIGEDLPEGTYFYIVILDGKDRYVGNLTLKR